MAGTQLEQARETWNNFDIDECRNVSWLAIDVIAAQVHRFAPGGVVAFIDQLLSSAFPERRHELKGAAVVCGDMEAERGVFEQVASVHFTDVDGFDLSNESLARVRPTSFSFHPRICDCNDLVLEGEQYDLIVAAHGIHHIFNVGGLLYQINKSLRPGGVLFLHEWIGPERLQIPRSNALISRMLLTTLFSRTKRTTHEKRVKGSFLQYGPEFFDPSEACNSTEITAQVAKYFDVKCKLEYGALCYPMFEGLGKNFQRKSRFDEARVRGIVSLESCLTDIGAVKPLFLVAICQKRNVWK